MTDSPPSPADMLAQAQAALHALLTGQQVVEISHNGKVIKYGPGNINQLRAYVAQLSGGQINTVRISSSKGLYP